MIILDATDLIEGDAAAATVVDYTIYGLDSAAASGLKNLADGQLAATKGTLYTAGAGDPSLKILIILVNTDTVARAVNLYMKPSGGTSRRIIPKDLSLGVGYSLRTDGVTLSIHDAAGLLQIATAASDHGQLTGLGDDDHTQYRLESADHSHQSAGLQAGKLDHGLALDGLADDDHTQYILKALLTTRGDLIRRSATVPERVALGTDGQKLASDGTDAVWEDDIAVIAFIIDGGGSAITTGQKGHLEIPFACTIQQVTTLADQSGSIVVDIWKDTYANFPPADADSITASAPPTLSTAQKAQDSTLTGWTTAIAAGDVLSYNVDSVTTIQRVLISLKVKKT